MKLSELIEKLEYASELIGNIKNKFTIDVIDYEELDRLYVEECELRKIQYEQKKTEKSVYEKNKSKFISSLCSR